MKVLLMGSTGMVGSEVLTECVKNDDITKITVVNRKPIANHSKIKEIIHENFLDFSRIKSKIINHDICFYCVGVYQGDVPEDRFIEITNKYIIALAKTIENKETVFCLFSAQGANPKSSILFARCKGQAEKDLMKFKFKEIYILRPGYIHPSNEGNLRKTLFYRIVEFFYPIINRSFPKYCTNSSQLAKAMVTVALNGSDKKILENSDIRKI